MLNNPPLAADYRLRDNRSRQAVHHSMRTRSHERDNLYSGPELLQILKNQDGSFTILNCKGKVLKASIPDSWLVYKLQRSGYCGEEYEEIRRQLDSCGKAEVVLNLSARRVPWVA